MGITKGPKGILKVDLMLFFMLFEKEKEKEKEREERERRERREREYNHKTQKGKQTDHLMQQQRNEEREIKKTANSGKLGSRLNICRRGQYQISVT